MLKKFLATTAVIALFTSPAFGSEETNASNKTSEKMFEEKVSVEFKADERGFVKAQENTIYASDLIGSYVYNGVGENAESIGDVNDMIVTNDGSLRGVIVGVGGFLGLGEKNVAISTDMLKWTTGPDGERWIVSEYSRQDLENAPAFEKMETENQEAKSENVDTDQTTTGSVTQSD